MRVSFRYTALALATASALLLAACNQDSTTTTTDAAQGEAAAGDAKGLQIAGLKDEKQQVSYVIGMSMARQLEEVKDEVDVDTIVRGLKDQLKGEEGRLVNDEQAQEIMLAFSERMQAKLMAEQLSKARRNAEEGQKFLEENATKEGVQTTASGLQYQVLSEGSGAKPGENSVVKVHYTGKLLDGTVFDDSTERGEPVNFPINAVVPGFREGLQLMSKGAKYRLWIPGNLGYGEQVPPGAPIPPNATLQFDVELIDIERP